MRCAANSNVSTVVRFGLLTRAGQAAAETM